MQDHHALRVYGAAQRLAVQVHALAEQLPTYERFALADQMRRAAASIAANIAEGSGRSTARDFCSYLDNALGSAREVECQIGHAQATGLLKGAAAVRAMQTSVVVQRMLTSLIVRIRRGATRASHPTP